ncbi:MAG: serine hydrolase [Chloroflexi bacterium]|nr:serine hydrolase [Chloroflexota bacterium]
MATQARTAPRLTAPVLVAMAVAAAFAATGCRNDESPAAGVVIREATATPPAEEQSPAVVGEPRPPGSPRLRLSESVAVSVAPLAELSADASAFLGGRAPQWGVAAILPGRGKAYVENAQQPFALASMVKVPIMLTLMQQAIDAGAELTEDQRWLLESMIGYSDNDAGYELWLEVGGGDAVEGFLDSIDVRGFTFPPGAGWGDTTATPEGFARLLGMLAVGAILDEPMRALALELMAGVIEGQRWGTTAAFPDGREPGVVALKNGWYPALTGWRVVSAAVSLGGLPEPLVLVVMTRNQDTFEYAAETVEGVSARIGMAVYGLVLPDYAPAEVTDNSPTVVLRFEPTAEGLPEVAGSCDEPSALLRREGAVACTVDGESYDPCFVPDPLVPVAVCGATPTEEGGGFAVRVEQLPEGERRRPGMAAWFLLLEGGATCTLVQEDPFDEDGDRVTYRCSDRSVIVGPIQRTATWWAYRAAEDFSTTATVAVTAAWN